MKISRFLSCSLPLALALVSVSSLDAFTFSGSGRLIVEPGQDYSRLDPSAVPGVTPWTSQLDADLAGATHTGPTVSNPVPGWTSWTYNMVGAGVAQFWVGNYAVFDTVEGFALTITKIDGEPVGVFNWALMLAETYVYSGTPLTGAPELMTVPIVNSAGGTEFVDFTSSGFELFGYVAGLFGQVDTGSGSDVPDLDGIIAQMETSSVRIDGSYVTSFFGKQSSTGEFLSSGFNGRDIKESSKVPDTGSTAALAVLGMTSLFFIRRSIKWIR